jgi:hypothetical protein
MHFCNHNARDRRMCRIVRPIYRYCVHRNEAICQWLAAADQRCLPDTLKAPEIHDFRLFRYICIILSERWPKGQLETVSEPFRADTD